LNYLVDHGAGEPLSADLETEGRILDAAQSTFLKHGTSGARMQEIADEAGVNKALLHYYFRSKNRLAEAVFLRAARRLIPPILDTLTSDIPLEDKVRSVVERYLTLLPEIPHLPAYVLSEMHHHPERIASFMASVSGVEPDRLRERLLTSLGRQIEVAAAAGRMRPIAPEQFITNLISLCVFPFAARPLVTLLVGGDRGSFDAMIAERRHTLADFFLQALRP
jgi:AcrR family transcriptional regulator